MGTRAFPVASGTTGVGASLSDARTTDDGSWARDPCPAFLRRLDSDPQAAMTGLWEWVNRTLAARTPASFSLLLVDRREEMPNRLFLHLTEGGFHRLRKYKPGVNPFSHWLLLVAKNLAKDLAKASAREAHRMVPITNQDESDQGCQGVPESTIPNPPDDSPEHRRTWTAFEEAVYRIVSELGTRCQMLLKIRLLQYAPREIAQVTGLDPKDVSDATRYCRERLVERLSNEGWDPGLFV